MGQKSSISPRPKSHPAISRGPSLLRGRQVRIGPRPGNGRNPAASASWPRESTMAWSAPHARATCASRRRRLPRSRPRRVGRRGRSRWGFVMGVLFVAAVPPWPVGSGNTQRMNHVISGLSAVGEVDVLNFSDPWRTRVDEPPSKAVRRWVQLDRPPVRGYARWIEALGPARKPLGVAGRRLGPATRIGMLAPDAGLTAKLPRNTAVFGASLCRCRSLTDAVRPR